MKIRDRINSILASLMRSKIVGRPVRIAVALWRSGDPPQGEAPPTVFHPGSEPVSSDFDSVIHGIEECLVRHENALREIRTSIRGDGSPVSAEQTPKQPEA